MRVPAVCILISLLLPSLSQAQDPDVIDKVKEGLQNLDGPSASASGPSNSAKVSAQASSDTSGASAQLSHLWGLTSNVAFAANLVAAAPFSDTNAPKPDIGSVSSLTAGVNSRLDTNWIILPPALSSTEVKGRTESYDKICDAFIEAALGKPYYYNWSVPRQTADPQSQYAIGLMDTVPSCPDLTRGSNLPDFIKRANTQIATRNKARSDHVSEAVLILHPHWRDAAKKASIDFDHFESAHSAPVWSVGLSFLGNQHSYSYVTAAAPSKVIKDSVEGYGIALNAAIYLNRISILAGLSYERPFKSAQGQQVCSPIGSTTSTSCNNAAVGAPTRTTARIVSVETRALVTNTLALGPRVEYDTASSNYGIKLPVYFVPNAKKILTSGLQVGWTKQNRFQGAVTIQKAFSFWN